MKNDKTQMNEILELAKRWMADTYTRADLTRIESLRIDPTWGAFARRMIRAATELRREKAAWQRERMKQIPGLLADRRQALDRYYANRREEREVLRVIKRGR